jgi:glyoxylase-like metal-dependent hydrolase (beta-lactamase superfamily II)
MFKAVVVSFFDEVTNTVTYIVADLETKKCAIIDSVLDYDASAGRTKTTSADTLIEFISQRGLTVEWILETHAHADHFSAAPYLQKTLGGIIAIGEHIPDIQRVFGGVFNTGADFRTDGSQFGRLFSDNETFQIGNLNAKIMYVPGHTPACVAYVIGDAVFVGDTLFMPDYGSARCDFPGGDAGTLYDSVHKLYELPDATRMFLCHDYKAKGRDFYAWETSVEEQKRNNLHLNTSVTRDEFIKMRTERDKTLDMPKLILPSIQVNMRAGQLPEPEDNGVSYLKIPLNSV